MNLKSRKILSLSLMLIILILFVYYVFVHFSDFYSLRLVSPWLVILLGVITLTSSALIGLVTDNLVSAFGIKLKFKEWFGLSIITTFYNTITPFRGGMAARAVYMKSKHKFSYTNFLASLTGTYVISFLIASLFGLISMWIIYERYAFFNWAIFFIFLIFFVVLFLIILFSPNFSETNNEFVNKLIRVMNGWNLISKKRKLIFIVSITATIQLIIGAFGTMVSYYMFGINISFVQALFLSAFGTFGILISITPAGLGIQEAVSVFAALALGIAPAQSLAVAILNRAVSMILIFILGPIYSYILLNHKPTKKNGKRKN